MEKRGSQQEGDEEEPSTPKNLEDDLSGIHLSDPDPPAHAKKKRKRKKGKKSKTKDDAGDNTPVPESAQQGTLVGFTFDNYSSSLLTIEQALSNYPQNDSKATNERLHRRQSPHHMHQYHRNYTTKSSQSSTRPIQRYLRRVETTMRDLLEHHQG